MNFVNDLDNFSEVQRQKSEWSKPRRMVEKKIQE